MLKPHGNTIPPMPARFALTVYKSSKYMASGSSTLSPILKAGAAVDGTGDQIDLFESLVESCRIKRRTLRAFR